MSIRRKLYTLVLIGPIALFVINVPQAFAQVCPAGEVWFTTPGEYYSFDLPAGCNKVAVDMGGASGSGAWGGGYQSNQGGMVYFNYSPQDGSAINFTGWVGSQPPCYGGYSGYGSNPGGVPGGGAGGSGGYRFGCGGGGYSSIAANGSDIARAGGGAGGTHFNSGGYLTNTSVGGCGTGNAYGTSGTGSGYIYEGGSGWDGGGAGGGSATDQANDSNEFWRWQYPSTFPEGGPNYINWDLPGLTDVNSVCGGIGGDGYVHISYWQVLPTFSLTVSSDPVPYGGNPGFTLNSSNAIYCHVRHQNPNGSWDMAVDGVTSGTYYPGVLNNPGTHYALSYCYGENWIRPNPPDSYIYTPFTVSAAPVCANGANNHPTCNACTSPLTWNGSSCVSCSNGGCSAGVCNNGANNPVSCNACTSPLAWNGSSCVSCSNGGCTAGVCNNGANNPSTCNACTAPKVWSSGTSSCIDGPTATLSASPTIIDQGQSATLTWNSTNATSCTGTGFTAGGTSGSRSTGTLSTPGTLNYQVICSGAAGSSAPAFASVEVLSPDVSITASPSRVQSGGSSQIAWSANGVTSCVVTGPAGEITSGDADAVTHVFPSGTQSFVITAQSVFTITCETNDDPLSESVTANVTASFQEF